ncbi:MAG: tRNA pseudouridine(55) synthase TruB [Treponema sp.]|nr:tRNA pseudouridine(55) synthase TruB [Treponema sp.]
MNSGIILLNKRQGITSFDALRDIKRELKTGKVGHTGTLDKFAQGLLIVLVGRALKLSQWFSGCDKKYEGRIHFGIETDTLDPEGKIIAESDLPTRQKVEDVLNQFTGNILQRPPLYSAIHVNGKRASNLARAGQMPEMKERPVIIYKIELKSWKPPFADIFVHCSSGTYIRSLARDIAAAAGSRGHLCKLVRTQIAGFSLNSDECLVTSEECGVISGECGITSEECGITNGECKNGIGGVLRVVDKSVIGGLGMAWFEVLPEEVEYILHGKPLGYLLDNKTLIHSASSAFPRLCETLYINQAAAVFEGDNLVAIVGKKDGKWKYECVI